MAQLDEALFSQSLTAQNEFCWWRLRFIGGKDVRKILAFLRMIPLYEYIAG